MSYSALDIAKYIVSKCIFDGFPVSNLRLQQILYWVQREFLRCGCPAFPEDMEAWAFGPVVPDVYYWFCGYGGMPIFWLPRDITDNVFLIPGYRNIVDPIIEEKRSLTPWDAAAEILSPDQAWSRIYDDGKGNHCVISKALIRADSLKGGEG